MNRKHRRGFSWWLARMQFYTVSLLGWLVGVLLTFVVLYLLTEAHVWLGLAEEGTFIGQVVRAWHLFRPAGSDSGQTWFQLVVSTVVFALFSVTRFGYDSLRYRYARDLARLRTLLIFDPEMALVRQRIILERAIASMTEPMQADQGMSLHDAVRALTLLDKLPENHARIAHRLRKDGNRAAHPGEEERHEQLGPKSALSLALENNRLLKEFLVWYRRNGHRFRMTPSEWDEVKSRVNGHEAADPATKGEFRAVGTPRADRRREAPGRGQRREARRRFGGATFVAALITSLVLGISLIGEDEETRAIKAAEAAGVEVVSSYILETMGAGRMDAIARYMAPDAADVFLEAFYYATGGNAETLWNRAVELRGVEVVERFWSDGYMVVFARYDVLFPFDEGKTPRPRAENYIVGNFGDLGWRIVAIEDACLANPELCG